VLWFQGRQTAVLTHLRSTAPRSVQRRAGGPELPPAGRVHLRLVVGRQEKRPPEPAPGSRARRRPALKAGRGRRHRRHRHRRQSLGKRGFGQQRLYIHMNTHARCGRSIHHSPGRRPKAPARATPWWCSSSCRPPTGWRACDGGRDEIKWVVRAVGGPSSSSSSRRRRRRRSLTALMSDLDQPPHGCACSPKSKCDPDDDRCWVFERVSSIQPRAFGLLVCDRWTKQEEVGGRFQERLDQVAV
jgi:hypothetical protein